MANKDFEVKQILKAYRQGLISDELFAEQMQEHWGATARQAGLMWPTSSTTAGVRLPSYRKPR